jgi:hypothetical protein
MNKYPVMATSAGNPVGDNQNSLSTDPRGSVHAKSAAACGTLR